MNEYTCKKCGEVCEVEFDDHDRHPFWPTIWCDKCNDYAGGSDKVLSNICAEATADANDRAYEEWKDRELK